MKFIFGFIAGIALMRYISDNVVTEEQKNEIAQNAKNLLQGGINYAQEVVDSSGGQ